VPTHRSGVCRALLDFKTSIGLLWLSRWDLSAAGCIAALWPAVQTDLSAGRPTFTREEHYLSALYAVTLGANDIGNIPSPDLDELGVLQRLP
jgi:hypothetical protein